MRARHGVRVWLALVTVYVVWGLDVHRARDHRAGSPAVSRHGASTSRRRGILLAIALPRGDTRGDRVGRPQIVAAFVFGGLFVTGHGALAWAQTVPAGVAALLVGTIPIWMALFDRLGFGHRLDVSAYFGIVLGFVGLAFLFGSLRRELDRQARCARDRPECDVLGGGVAYLARSAASRRPLVSAGLASMCGGSCLPDMRRSAASWAKPSGRRRRCSHSAT